MLMEKQIEADDFKSIKKRYEDLNRTLTSSKVNLGDSAGNRKYLRGCIEYLGSLDTIYNNESGNMRKLMIESTFAESLSTKKTVFEPLNSPEQLNLFS